MYSYALYRADVSRIRIFEAQVYTILSVPKYTRFVHSCTDVHAPLQLSSSKPHTNLLGGTNRTFAAAQVTPLVSFRMVRRGWMLSAAPSLRMRCSI